MPVTFEDSLKAIITGMNDAFEKADADLHRAVTAAAQSLAKVTNGAADMVLRKTREEEQGINYELVVNGKGKDFKIADFYVSGRGYPIIIDPKTGGPISRIHYKDKEALEGYFSELASNPDSPFVTAVAYIMRSK